MNKYLAYAFIGLFLFACNANDSKKTTNTDSTHQTHTDTASRVSNPMKDMHDAMSGMMQHMKTMKVTGDPDHDFATMMKHHHEGAIKMAQAEIAGGANADMKAKAQKMIDDQQKEIAEFDQFLQSHQPSGSSDFGQKAMGMMTEMGAIKMDSRSLDAMFASMMIPHHQDAINMSKEYLKSGKISSIKTIANNIIQSQQKEINELQDWLNKQ